MQRTPHEHIQPILLIVAAAASSKCSTQHHTTTTIVAHEFLALFALEKRTKRNQKRAIRRRPTSTSQMSFYEHIAAAVVGL